MINVIISDEAKTLHFFEQIYKSDYLTKEQMTKYEILSDTNKVWDKTLAHFMDLFSLRNAYIDDKAAGFETVAHVHDHTSTRSITTANTENDFIRDCYIESQEESLLAAAWNYCASDATTLTPIPTAAIDPVTLLQTELAEQCKQVAEVMVMAQNATLMAALSKVAEMVMVRVAEAAEAKAAAATTAVGTKHHGKRQNSAPTATKWSSMILQPVSPSRRTRTNAPQDGAPNVGNDRDWGPRIMTQYYIGSVKINHNVYQHLLPGTIIRTPLASQVEELDNQISLFLLGR